MRLTDSCDLALRVLIFAASHPDRLFTIDEVVAVYHLPRGTVMKVVNALTRGKFLIAQRGRSGGLRLARAPTEIRISDVILQIEPDLELVECMRPGNECLITAQCGLINPLHKALRAFLDTLGQYTLADMILPAAIFDGPRTPRKAGETA